MIAEAHTVLRPNERLADGRVNGAVAKAHLQWVRNYHGGEAASRVLDELPQEIAAEVTTDATSSWCSFRAVVLLDRAIERQLGRGKRGFLRELGRYSAHLSLRSGSTALHGLDPHAFFRAFQFHHHRFQDFGSVFYEQLSEKGGIVSHRHSSSFSSTYCESALGYYEQVIVMHGATPQLVVESSCLCAGEPSCTFELEWE